MKNCMPIQAHLPVLQRRTHPQHQHFTSNTPYLNSPKSFKPTSQVPLQTRNLSMSSSFCAGADPTGGHLFLRARFARELRDFASNQSSTYHIIHTVPSTPTPPSSSNPLSDLKTLYVLDSSFNPPTKAHLTIARNAVLRDQQQKGGASGTTTWPARLVFLLATENADKKPKPASFEDRLVMMAFCAEELRASLRRNGEGSLSSVDSSSSSSSLGTAPTPETNLDISIDIAVTKHPFFMDKAMSIDDSGIYGAEAQQVHLTGYDTLIRIFNSKYYPSDRKLGVLEPFLSRHRLRVCYRVDGDGRKEEASRRQQERYVEGIGDGSREDEGMKREWRSMVDLVDDASEVEGVSSTKARRAAVEAEWEELEQLTGVKVAEYVMGQNLYDEAESVRKSYD